MNETNAWQTPIVAPIPAYDDVPRAVEWLTDAFRFVERREARVRWPGGVMAWMEIGSGLITLASGEPQRRSPSEIRRTTVELKVYVRGVDAHHQHAHALGGDLAYQYGRYGHFGNVGTQGALNVLGDTSFGAAPQTFQLAQDLQAGVARLS